MNVRKRFLNTVRGLPADRVPLWSYAFRFASEQQIERLPDGDVTMTEAKRIVDGRMALAGNTAGIHGPVTPRMLKTTTFSWTFTRSSRRHSRPGTRKRAA